MTRYGYAFAVALGVLAAARAASATQRALPAATPPPGLDDPRASVPGARFLKGGRGGGSRGSSGGGSRGSSYGGARGGGNGGGGGGGMSTTAKWIVGGVAGLGGLACLGGLGRSCRSQEVHDKPEHEGGGGGEDDQELPTVVATLEPEAPPATAPDAHYLPAVAASPEPGVPPAPAPAGGPYGTAPFVPGPPEGRRRTELPPAPAPAPAPAGPYVPEPFVPGRREGMPQTGTGTASPY